MKKIIFLDYDGVLHPASTPSSQQLFSCSHFIEKVIDEKSCDIVISSSWRFHMDYEKLIANLPKKIKDCVIGSTGEPYIGQYSRYNEILDYLKASKLFNDVKWIALDDSLFEFPKNCEQLIVCNPNTGVSAKESGLLKKWLES